MHVKCLITDYYRLKLFFFLGLQCKIQGGEAISNEYFFFFVPNFLIFTEVLYAQLDWS